MVQFIYTYISNMLFFGLLLQNNQYSYIVHSTYYIVHSCCTGGLGSSTVTLPPGGAIISFRFMSQSLHVYSRSKLHGLHNSIITVMHYLCGADTCLPSKHLTIALMKVAWTPSVWVWPSLNISWNSSFPLCRKSSQRLTSATKMPVPSCDNML